MRRREDSGRRPWAGCAAVAAAVAALGGMAAAGWFAWRLSRPGPRPVWRAAPVLTGLLAAQAGRIDYADAWSAPIRDGESTDPAAWAGVLAALPPPVQELMRLRDLLVRPLGLVAAGDGLPETGFPLLAQTDREVVLGVDDKHLSFRVGITTADARATITTTVTLSGLLGRPYWAVVRWFHPLVVRATLSQATRSNLGAGSEPPPG
ncbi:MAG: DUF2867 domain-containing protein [Bifidobacteriaceae bacterium]|jgi:hypothetical protein|nr:DUF2867 domain-containing protein [Bifidobacteriaceae bacterium]